MGTIKKLAGQTAIYGLSSIVGRLINYLLVPFYTRVFSTAEYGVVSELFAYAAFLMILFTYGMETSFFHFSEKKADRRSVYSTGFVSLAGTSFLLAFLMILFSDSIAGWLRYDDYPEYVTWFACILFLDAVAAIPFASLRQRNKAKRFVSIKLINISLNVFFNVFFLVGCPAWSGGEGAWAGFIDAFYAPGVGVGYVFISNLLASLVTLVILAPELKGISWKPDFALLREMVVYGLPLLVAGLAGMINETLDRAVYKFLAPDPDLALRELGVYSACYKLSIVMTLFIQTYRYAAEPFFFSQQDKDNSRELYASVMKYFVIACSFIFLVVLLFLDIFKLFIGEQFRGGLKVVPVLLLANMCLGIYFNLSMWYKLTGKTRYGAYFSILGALVTIVLLFALIPSMGYMGAAWATLACYAVMMVVSYLTGRKAYPVPYDLQRIGAYIILALVVYFAHVGLLRLLEPGSLVKYLLGASLLTLFAGFVLMLEKKPARTARRRR